jgi:acyl-CoA synthetase (AMP-forming)/AMP-acid ligase II
VEVVDESGRPVPSGEPGRLRIRSASMAEGYLDDPEATRRFFQDGWFYPSDIAILDGPRRIKVIGRADEMITTAGGKKAPSDIEAACDAVCRRRRRRRARVRQ